MFGGLYGDLPDAKDSGSADKVQTSNSGSGWSRPQLHVPAKRPAPAMPLSVLRSGELSMLQERAAHWVRCNLCTTGKYCTAGVNALLRLAGRGRGSQAARGDGAGGRGGGGPGPAAELAAASFLSVNGAPLRDEYDPARPNDYAAIRRQREEARKQAEQEAERQEAMRRAEAAAAALAAARPDEARDVPPDTTRDGPATNPGAPAVPVAAASGEEAYLRRARSVRSDYEHQCSIHHGRLDARRCWRLKLPAP